MCYERKGQLDLVLRRGEGVAEDAYVESQRVDRRRYFDHVLLDLTSAAVKSD